MVLPAERGHVDTFIVKAKDVGELKRVMVGAGGVLGPCFPAAFLCTGNPGVLVPSEAGRHPGAHKKRLQHTLLCFACTTTIAAYGRGKDHFKDCLV